jgi:hypothetical protein
MLRPHRQRSSKRHRRSGRWRRGSYARPRDRSAPGSGTKHPYWGQHRRAVSPSPRTQSQAGGGVSNGTVAPRLYGGGSLCAASARGSWAYRPVTASTPISTSTTRIRLRERARSSLPSRHCCGPCPPPAPRGASAHRASGRPAGRELGVSHPPARRRAGRRGRAGGRTLGPHRRSDPPIWDAHRLKIGSSTRAEHGTATPATSSTLGGRAKQMREWRQPTTLDEVDATTATKTARRRRNPREPMCSAGRSARRPSPALPPTHDRRQVQRGDRSPRVA